MSEEALKPAVKETPEPVVEATSASTFYDQGEHDEGEKGRIADPEVAHELADVQATQGVNARITREEELKRQHEDGKTDEEKNNNKLMDLLKEKYPDAFLDIIDSKGRRLLLSLRQKRSTASETESFSDIAYAEAGAYAVNSNEVANPNKIISTLDVINKFGGQVDGLIDCMKEEHTASSGKSYRLNWKDTNGKDIGAFLQVSRLDLRDPKLRGDLQRINESTQSYQNSLREQEEIKNKIIPAEDLINSL
ncbi:MAG: hypothetical protein ABII10_00890 [Candidatus Paceibacterota bacterium]